MKHSKIDFMLFEHSCLSDSRMTCICDLYYCLCDHILQAAGHCLHSSPHTLSPLVLDSVSPSCYYIIIAAIWVVPWIPHRTLSKLLGSRMSSFPFCVISPGMFSFQTSPWVGHLWSQSWWKYGPTCAWHLQTLPWGPVTTPTKMIQNSFLKKPKTTHAVN